MASADKGRIFSIFHVFIKNEFFNLILETTKISCALSVFFTMDDDKHVDNVV